ncbi:MAG: hypothetical protein JXQ29_08440 [Planctomycetes bacterium]|nr:hypothetical protein [Planctomycetota bacterium]
MNQELTSLLKTGDNPFENAFIRTPWDQSFVDVAAINQEASQAILKRMCLVGDRGLSRGVLLLGEPGFGKSHLLARLRTTVHDVKVLTFVEPPPSPERVLRHVLREAIVRLGAGAADEISPLEWLAANFFVTTGRSAVQATAFAAPEFSRIADKWAGGTVHLPDLHAALAPHFDALANHAIGADADLDPGVLRAFFVLIHESKTLRTLAMRWLRGDGLADEDLARLGIARTAGSASADGSEDRARRTIRQVLKICRAAGKVLVLCVDQIEEVNDGPAAEGTGIRALGEALSNLIQYEQSLLVLTACLRDRWELFAGRHLNKSQVDRIAETTITLKPLVYEQAVALVQSRLDAWEPGGGRKLPADQVFDLAALQAWMASEVVVHPRAVIQHCGALIEELRDGTAALPLGRQAAEKDAVPIQRQLRLEVEEVQRLRSAGVKHVPGRGGALEDGPALIEPPMSRSARDKNEPNLSLDPVGWYFGTFEQTIRDLQDDPTRDLKNVDEQDLAATVHELLYVLARKGAQIAGGRVSTVRLGHYLKDRRYFGHCLELLVHRGGGQEERRGLVFSSADHFQSIRALLERTLEAMETTPGFFIRTMPLRNTYRKSREVMQTMPLGAAFIMEEKDYFPLVAAQKLRHAAAAGDLTMGPKVVDRDEADSLLVRSGVLEDNRVIRTAFQNAPRLATKATVA